MLDRLTTWTVRYRGVVIGTWALIIALGLLAAIHVDAHLTAVTAVPGSASSSANALLDSAFDENAEGSFVIVRSFGTAGDDEIAAMKQQVAAAVRQIPTAVVQQQRAIGGVLYASVGTALPLIEASAQTPRLRSALAAVGLSDALVTGPPALEHDVRPILAEDLQRGGLVGLVLAIGILVVAFGWRRRVLVPVIVAVATIAGAMCVVYLLAMRITMVLYVPSIVELVGLGLALDYTLLLVHRHQLAGGDAAAIVTTMRTAGRTVLWAGMTAAIGLTALLLMPIPLVRSLGIAGCVVPLVALLAAITLTPALLSLFGTERPGGLLSTTSTIWDRVGASVTQRPRTAVAAGLLACTVLAAPLTQAALAPASLTALPDDVPASQAVAAITKRLGPGVITPHEVLVTVPAGTARDLRNDEARQRLATALTKLPEVFGVFTDTGTNYIDASETHQRIFVVGRYAFSDPRTVDLVDKLRALRAAAFGYADGSRIAVAGAPAQGVDFLQAIRDSVPLLVLLILFVAFMALRSVFGSWRIASISIALNLVSLAAACGVVVAVFQLGLGSMLLRTYHVPQIESWTFVFMFALLFGLTTDYQVFVVRSMLEAHGPAGTRIAAITAGLGRTGGLVTLAAVAFVCALTGLVFGRIAGLQELGVGLAAGVLIDATIVRGVLLPGALALLRRF